MANSISSLRKQANKQIRENPSERRDQKGGERLCSAPLELPYATDRDGKIASLATLSSIDLTLTMLSK
jgi:hypothetical protein